jgi:hypothetical protein
MAEDVHKRNVVAVDAQQVGDDIVLTIMGSFVEPTLQRLSVTGIEADGTPISADFPNAPPHPGDTLTLTGAGNPGQDHIVAVAELADGLQQVVLDTCV